jgi:hypothetical protein
MQRGDKRESQEGKYLNKLCIHLFIQEVTSFFVSVLAKSILACPAPLHQVRSMPSSKTTATACPCSILSLRRDARSQAVE